MGEMEGGLQEEFLVALDGGWGGRDAVACSRPVRVFPDWLLNGRPPGWDWGSRQKAEMTGKDHSLDVVRLRDTNSFFLNFRLAEGNLFYD